MPTTLGHQLLIETLPEDIAAEFVGKGLAKGQADELLTEVAKRYPEKFKEISHRLMQHSRQAVYREGATIKYKDMQSPIDRKPYLKAVKDAARKLKADPNLTEAERKERMGQVLQRVQKEINAATYETALAAENPFALQVKSKARGNPIQLAAMLSTPSVFANNEGAPHDVFIERSFSEGLRPHEYYLTAFGARDAVRSTKRGTASAGYLGKQMSNATNNLVITADDCGTGHGFPVEASDADNIGAVLAADSGDFKAGTVITKSVMARMRQAGSDEVVLRSPLTCENSKGLCAHCAGKREHGRFPEIGERVGVSAGAALAERMAQSSLGAKHTAGQTEAGDRIFAGFPLVEAFTQNTQQFAERATVADLDGKVTGVEEAPQGGHYVNIGEQRHYIQPGLAVKVKPGEVVEAGDQISDGIASMADIVQHKGIGEGRRYFTQRLTSLLRDSKYSVSRRNVELLSRGMIDTVEVGDDGWEDSLPGARMSYAHMARKYQPREDAANRTLHQAVGSYLEKPALHYSIGTRVTPRVQKQLERHGVKEVLVHGKAPSIAPRPVALRDVPGEKDDWMGQLGSNYLKTRLLKSVSEGAISDAQGLDPAPALALGVGLGKSPPVIDPPPER